MMQRGLQAVKQSRDLKRSYRVMDLTHVSTKPFVFKTVSHCTVKSFLYLDNFFVNETSSTKDRTDNV